MPANPQANATTIMGPFVGSITASSVKIWLNLGVADADTNVFVTLKLLEQAPKSEAEKKNPDQVVIQPIENPVVVQSGVIKCLQADLGTGTVTIGNLAANAKYSYQLWQDEAHSIPLYLGELTLSDLYFWTLPEDGYGRQLDFLLMSCHFPETAKADGFEGFAIWRQMTQIRDENKNVRFAILCGDQVYADEVETEVLKEQDESKRKELYLKVYRKFWNNIYYRRVLCSLPAILMWDDHDITDGWGSREDSFVGDSSTFKPEWLTLFESAKGVFKVMQAQRNPDPLSPNYERGFDFCFRVGKAAFVVADLRSNRNKRIKQIWDPRQLEEIREWVQDNKSEFDTLFFVSSVVFSHGSPDIERSILKYWFHVLDLFNWIGKIWFLRKCAKAFNDKVGDLRDDINDSWGAEVNAVEADLVLDFLFGLQNPPAGEKPVNVVILTGDIHTPGHSIIYSADPAHATKAVIPHIVATPVAYKELPWAAEAIFRHLTKVVPLGQRTSVTEKGEAQTYTAQVSHHFCYRNVVVVSLRNYEADESYVKVKYYLEGFPEPQIVLFDLIHSSRREAIDWPEHLKAGKAQK